MEKKGIIGCLLDFGFTQFVTTRIVPILYILGIIGSAIVAILVIIGGFTSGSGAVGALSLIMAPIIFVFNVLMTRIWLEMIIAVFRVAENTQRLVELSGSGTPPPTT